MPSFVKGGGVSTPFGRNEYMRSTRNMQFESAMFSAASFPAITIDGNTGQKILQPGLAVAKITSGPEAGKYGGFQTGATDGRADVANLVGLNDTFLPWQLIEGDREIGYLYHGTAVQAWCLMLDAAGLYVPLSNTVADALRGIKGADINFK